MGILNRLFSRTANATSGRMTDEESVKIISAYGNALLDRKSVWGPI
jgi:hypothetical protein